MTEVKKPSLWCYFPPRAKLTAFLIEIKKSSLCLSPCRHRFTSRGAPQSGVSSADHRAWADRVKEENDCLRHDSDEEMDGTWGRPDLVRVSEETHKLLTVACTRSVSNETRKHSHGRFLLPKVVATKLPNLDPFLRTEVP